VGAVDKRSAVVGPHGGSQPSIWNLSPAAKPYPSFGTSTRLFGQPKRQMGAARLWDPTPERTVPLASLGLGSCRPLDSLFKSSSAAFQIEVGETEAQKIAAHDLIGNPSQPPCVQRSQRRLRALLQSEYGLLREALGLGGDR